jgi:transposase
MGHDSIVVAPSLIPSKPGDRVKTDRRDSESLARLHRANELTAVWVPDSEQESMRDLTRAREDMKHLERQSRQRLSAFLLRHGQNYEAGKSKWTQAYFRWLEQIKFDQPIQQIVFQEYIDSVQQQQTRVKCLETEMEKALKGWCLAPVVEALMALRGCKLITAMTIMAELGDITRFDSPRQLMAYLGLVPSEYSSGKSTRRGGITKTGNGHVRKVLIESAWCYRFPARKTAHIQRRAELTSPTVQGSRTRTGGVHLGDRL